MAEKKFELKSGNKPTFFNMGSYSLPTNLDDSPLNQKCYEGTCPDFSVKGSKTGRKLRAWWQRTTKTWKKNRARRKAIRDKKKSNKEGLVFDAFTRTWVRK